MAERKRYRRCANCGAVLNPEDSFCPQCGINTERSYEGRAPVRSAAELRETDRKGKRDGQSRRRLQSAENGGQHRRESSKEASRQEMSKEEPQNRYRQENLGRSWSEDWGRPVDENRITAMQCVMLVLIVMLVVLLLALGAFWMLGRSSDHSLQQRGGQQLSVRQTERESEMGDVITILNPQTDAPAGTADTAANTQQADAGAGQQPETDSVQQADAGAAEQPGQDSAQQADAESAEQSGPDSAQQADAESAEQSGPDGAQQADAGAAEQSGSDSTQQADAGAVEQSGSDSTQQADAGAAEQSGPDSAQQAQADTSSAASWSQPESSSRLLTDSDLEGLTYDELQMAINEIYARHERIFKTPEIGSYFESQPWYEGTLDADHFDESVFSSIEGQNIQFILEKMGDG